MPPRAHPLRAPGAVARGGAPTAPDEIESGGPPAAKAMLLVGPEATPPAWLTRATPDGTPIRCTTDLDTAQALLAQGAVSLVIFEPHVASGESTRSALETVVRDFPRVATVGIAIRANLDRDHLLQLASAGAHAVILVEDRNQPEAVRHALLEATARCCNEHVWGDLEPTTPARVRPILAYGLTHAQHPLSVHAVARALGLHRKTLAERCALAGTLPPQQLLGWCRLFAAAVLLEDRGRLVDHVAQELGFPSGTAFRNLLKRYTGSAPSELRTVGIVAEVSRQFCLALLATDGE